MSLASGFVGGCLDNLLSRAAQPKERFVDRLGGAAAVVPALQRDDIRKLFPAAALLALM